MPIFTLERSYKSMSEKEWKGWITQFKNKPFKKKELMSIFQVMQLLGWKEEKVLKRGKIQGQRAFWIFIFENPEIDFLDEIVEREVYVYPRQVFYEMRKQLLNRSSQEIG